MTSSALVTAGFNVSRPFVVTRGYSSTAVFPMNGVEILYPIQPTAKTNKIAYRQDDGQWDSAKKSTNNWRHEFSTLRMKVQANNFATFYQFLRDNKGIQVPLETPGFRPFIRATETNNVYIHSFGQPKRVYPKLYEINITFLHSSITATTP